MPGSRLIDQLEFQPAQRISASRWDPRCRSGLHVGENFCTFTPLLRPNLDADEWLLKEKSGHSGCQLSICGFVGTCINPDKHRH